VIIIHLGGIIQKYLSRTLHSEAVLGNCRSLPDILTIGRSSTKKFAPALQAQSLFPSQGGLIFEEYIKTEYCAKITDFMVTRFKFASIRNSIGCLLKLERQIPTAAQLKNCGRFSITAIFLATLSAPRRVQL
jgi:hypothetical protein